MNAKTRPALSAAWSFVRTTAWSMILLGVLCGLLSLMLAVMGWLLNSSGAIDYMMEAPELQASPPWMGAVFRYMLPFSLFSLALSLATLIAGAGLLARHRGALGISIWIFWLGALGNLVGLFVHAWLLKDFRIYLAGSPEWMLQMIETNYWPAQISGALFGLVFMAGFAWTAWKLGTPPVRAEFGTQP